MTVLILGLGSIGKRHVNVLYELYKAVEIYALRSSKNAETYKAVHNIYSLEEVEHVSFSFAIIATPTACHLKDIENLLPLEIPLFIEKPLYYNLDIEKLLAQVKLKGIKTYVACNLRFLESLEFVKSYLKDQKYGVINEVNVYCGSYLPEWRAHQDFKTSYSALPELGGGVHLDLIHELDYIYWLFGEPKTCKGFLKSGSSLAIEAVSSAQYLLDYKRFFCNITLNYFRRDPKRVLEIVCSEVTITVDLLKNKVSAGDRLLFKSSQLSKDTYYRQLEYFVNHLSKKSFNDLHEAAKVLRLSLNQIECC